MALAKKLLRKAKIKQMEIKSASDGNLQQENSVSGRLNQNSFRNFSASRVKTFDEINREKEAAVRRQKEKL